MRQLIAGNWKMHGLTPALAELRILREGLMARSPTADVLICPPATLIAQATAIAEGHFGIGAQDCHAEKSGAYTGEISAEMLGDVGASMVIVGHSERRLYFGESDQLIAAKAQAVWRAGLCPIVCVGETEAQRLAGQANDVVSAQLVLCVPDDALSSVLAVAYEPVWAIGTGRTPSLTEIAEIHGVMRATLVDRFGAEVGGAVRLLYGGSVKGSNAEEILCLQEVNGALVGGASLKAAEFLTIVDVSPDEETF